MPAPRRFVALLFLALVGSLGAQTAAPPSPTVFPAVSAAPDDRAAKVAERYRAMLAANPTEGMAFDRLWKFHEERGTTAELLDGYQQAAARPGADLATLLVDGYLLKKVGKPDEAAAVYERANQRDPASPLPWIASAELATARNQPDEAANAYAQALTKMPATDRRRTDLLLRQGTALLAAGKTTEAAECWEQIVSANPADLNVRRQLAGVYEQNGFPDRAVAQDEYIEAHAEPAARANALRELGRLQEAQGHFDAARDALERGLALTSRDNWLHGDLQTRLIHLYQRAGRVLELAARWQAAVAAVPRDLGGYLQLEALAEAEGDVASERGWLEKIVALAPNDREDTLKLAGRLTELGERPRAAELYDGLLKRQPNNLELLLARADLDVQMGQPAAAVSRIEARAAQTPADESVVGPALNFFLDHRLAGAAERMLRAEVARQPTAVEPALALAKFLFSERRPADARVVLDTLDAQPGTPAERAGRLLQTAETYRQGGESERALRGWRQAAALQPDNPAPLLAAADVLRADGDLPGATALLEQAIPLSASGAERLATERKLFEILRGDEEATRPDHLERTLLVGRPPNQRPPSDSTLGRYLANLAAAADDQPTAANFLRLARWQSWAHDDPAAVRAAQRAIALDPANLPARELIASVAVASHQTPLAEQMLSQLLQLDPSHQDAALRELANLKLAAGDVAESLQLFERLQQLAPGSRPALTDLALAQQRADQWFDALATWERAYALPGGTPAQREEIRRPLLAAYEHLGQFSQAVGMLLRAVDEQTDLVAKEDLFRQLADFSHKHGLDDRLRDDLQNRVRGHPNDYFTLVSLARLRQESGESGEAYHLLQRAYYSSPDQARSLRELVQTGEELGEAANAIADQQRLLALPGQSTPENLEKLAALQTSDLQSAAATATWDALIARFPRDPAALGQAADYFEKVDQLARARDLQRAIVALDPSDFARALRLAAMEVKAGEPSAAESAYESVLAHTRPEPPGESLTLPDELKLPVDYVSVLTAGTGRFRLRPMMAGGALPMSASAVPKGDEGLRLEAIRALSRLLFPTAPGVHPDEPAQAAWLARWQRAADAGVRNEPLQAFYFSGSGAATMPLLAGWLKKNVGDESLVRGAFLAAGLRLADYPGLAKWAWSDPSSDDHVQRSSALLGAIGQFLTTGGKPGPNFVGELFPPGIGQPVLLWESAKQFADLHWYTQAAELGHHVLASVRSGRAEYASGVAEWELYAGLVPQARETLRAAVEEGGGTTFDVNSSPVLSALREYYLLLPTGERAAFVADYLRRMSARGDKVHATLAGVLLHGLDGDETAARRDLDTLLATRLLAADENGPSPNIRRWAFLLANGLQLESWNLDAEAVYLWRRALSEATAFDQQFGEAEGTLVEIRRRLLGAEVSVAANPEEARACVETYLAGSPPTGTASGVAGEMLNNSRFDAAIQIDEYLCRVEPNDSEHWRNLFAAYEAAGEPDRLEQTLARIFQSKGAFPEGLPREDFVCRWAAARERNGDPAGACRLLQDEQSTHPGLLPICVQLAQTYERAGRWAEAAATWRETTPLDPTAVPILGEANAEEHLGHPEQATKILHDNLRGRAGNGQDEIAIRLNRIYLATGRVDDAKALANDLLREVRLDVLPPLAASFVAANQRAYARELLASAVLRAHDASLRVALQQALTSLYPVVNGNAAEFLHQMTRMETFTHDVPAYHENWEVVKYKLARAADADAWLEKDLAGRWDHGKGDYLAGERLASLYLETHRDEPLARVIDEFDHRPLLPEQLLYSIEDALIQSGHPALALPISERLYHRFPQNEQYALQRAVALWKAGQTGPANQLLATIAATAVLRDDLTGHVADTYLDLGDKKQAQVYLEQAVQGDRLAAHSTDAFVQLARLYLETGRPADAGNLLRMAYRQDACNDFTPLVEYLSATGQLDGKKATEMPAPDFLLTFRRRAQLLVAVSQRLEKDGRREEARSLLLSHPGFLAEVPATAAQLCWNLPADQRGQMIDRLKTALSQLQPPYPQLVRTWDALQVQADRSPVSASSGGQ